VLGERARRRQVRKSVGEPEAVAHPVVVHRQHIRPPELEHQHHLHGPAADAAHLREPRDDGFVVERHQRRRIGHHARDRVRCEIPERRGLRRREADRTQRLGRRALHLPGGGEGVAVRCAATRVPAAIALRIQRDEAREDGIGRLTADLLRGDGPREMPERRGARFRAQPVRPGRRDQRRHHGVDAPEMRQQYATVGRADRCRVCHFWHAGHQ